MNEHIRLAITALELVKEQGIHGYAEAFRTRPELLAKPWEGKTVMDEFTAELKKIDAAIAYLKGLDG